MIVFTSTTHKWNNAYICSWIVKFSSCFDQYTVFDSTIYVAATSYRLTTNRCYRISTVAGAANVTAGTPKVVNKAFGFLYWLCLLLLWDCHGLFQSMETNVTSTDNWHMMLQLKLHCNFNIDWQSMLHDIWWSEWRLLQHYCLEKSFIICFIKAKR